MTVYFIGAGPGDPELLTLKAQKRIAACPVCLFAGSLVPPEVVAGAPEGARVHSGDPSLYGAIAEQIRWLRECPIFCV
jgi:precorrin-4/cobalt-precorrin-4 C11-methyltransferase